MSEPLSVEERLGAILPGADGTALRLPSFQDIRDALQALREKDARIKELEAALARTDQTDFPDGRAPDWIDDEPSGGPE